MNYNQWQETPMSSASKAECLKVRPVQVEPYNFELIMREVREELNAIDRSMASNPTIARDTLNELGWL